MTTPFTAALSSAVLTGSLTGLALSSCASAPEDQDDVSACAVPPYQNLVDHILTAGVCRKVAALSPTAL